MDRWCIVSCINKISRKLLEDIVACRTFIQYISLVFIVHNMITLVIFLDILSKSEFHYISHDPSVIHELLLNCPHQAEIETSLTSIKFRKRASSLSLVSRKIIITLQLRIWLTRVLNWLSLVQGRSVHYSLLKNTWSCEEGTVS